MKYKIGEKVFGFIKGKYIQEQGTFKELLQDASVVKIVLTIIG